MPNVVNWREAQPVISHESAIVWSCLQPKPARDDGARQPSQIETLERLGGLTVHAVQGRKQSDYHRHENREQLYYIIEGAGQILCGDILSPVEEGDIIYLPSGQYHQLFNPAEAWLLHHVINMPVDGDGGRLVSRNWRDAAPQSDGLGAVRWHLLGPESEREGGCLRGLAFIDREMVQPRRRSKERNSHNLEQIYYVLAGEGKLVAEGQETAVREGDAIHLLPGTTYHISNTDKSWLTYLIVAAR
ncbi:MAG: cupin domain-containing protein [Caldilineaceae bacterium SB0670_bin_27]|uniref:Cupin domain-containing protein n=1 Tax=Caldilineaceae bacterium SB0664_bin_27 TaxID=2605260 RepID=A0A6B0YTT1_9CHLR|nr:cupin domain-containing protein [Caldilineaceae bacterium SB0664_bin_27]MYJ79978.1 cupin domain-containing protein [Caldilineaceae bacterium SB0670_bin_27]